MRSLTIVSVNLKENIPGSCWSPASFTAIVRSRTESGAVDASGNIGSQASRQLAKETFPRRQLYQLALSLPAVDINRAEE